MNQGYYIGELLKEKKVAVSAPCRLDIGGTWDLKAFALPYRHVPPATTNIVLNMRTKVSLHQYQYGWVNISDTNASEEFPLSELRFDTKFGLLFAIASYFQLHGVNIQISYAAPPRSGLGGSGTLAVATIAALNSIYKMFSMPILSKSDIVELAHEIEDGLRFSYTGMQDQCAAAYGGVKKWTWKYASSNSFFEYETVLKPEGYAELESRLVLAYLGMSHDSNDVNSQQVASFLNGSTRKAWLRINEIAKEFAVALRESNWQKAANLIQEETEIRLKLVPSRITPLGKDLMRMANEMQAGFSTAGAGNGGCVWALCITKQDAGELKVAWEKALHQVETAKLLDAQIDSEGLVVQIEGEGIGDFL